MLALHFPKASALGGYAYYVFAPKNDLLSLGSPGTYTHTKVLSPALDGGLFKEAPLQSSTEQHRVTSQLTTTIEEHPEQNEDDQYILIPVSKTSVTNWKNPREKRN